MAAQPSEALKNRVFDLIARKKVGDLSEEESAELEKHLQLEHKMRLAKARLRRKLL